MQKIAKFEKVSFEQFKKDWLKNNPSAKTQWSDEELQELYDSIKLPDRATNGSAGHDIYTMFDINLPFKDSMVIPTGIRCSIADGWFLDLNPRSGHGFKYGLRLANTRGIIDADYYDADNEGHIMIKIVNNDDTVNKNKEPFVVEKGKAFCQGIFTIFGITENDNCTTTRHGGFGSTDNK